MFSNFLYFLIALLIYTSSGLFGKPEIVHFSGVYYALLSVLVFALTCRISFSRLGRQALRKGRTGLDLRINRLIARLSILALGLFAVDIYVLRLDRLVEQISLFSLVPTLGALVFLMIFLLYLVLIWNFAYGLQKHFFPGKMSKNNFIFSNISFALPALLPWFLLSIFSDLIGFLPFPKIKDFLGSPEGEMAYIVLFLAVVAIFGPILIRRIWHCTSLSPGAYRDKIEQVCKGAGLAYRDILKWELFGGAMITAGVMGLVGRFRYILVTPALLDSLEDDEIEAVILHEIGHVKKHHMLFYLLFFVGFIACNFVFFEPLILVLSVASPLYDAFALLGIERGNAHGLMTALALIGGFIIYFRFGFGFFMRNFERQADLHVFEFYPNASAMISTFRKIAFLSGQSLDKPNWHHFGIGERIRFLEKCQIDPGSIGRHHKRIRRLMAGYAVLIFIAVALGLSTRYGPLKQEFSRFITETALLQELAVDPDNSELYVFVGDYYYDKKAYQKARNAWENVIRIDHGNIHALNNLAWLLATCPNLNLRDNKRALDLASQAIAIQKEAFILDTYAEALYVNQRFEEAIHASRQALAVSDSKKAYYQGQIRRFETALAAFKKKKSV